MQPEPSRKERHRLMELFEQLFNEDPTTRLSADILVAYFNVFMHSRPEKESLPLGFRPYLHFLQEF